MQEKLDSSYDICALVNLILIFVIYKIRPLQGKNAYKILD